MIKGHNELGPRGSAVITSKNRNHARQWLSDNKVSSYIYNALNIAALNQVYNDTTDAWLSHHQGETTHPATTVPVVAEVAAEVAAEASASAAPDDAAQQLASLLTQITAGSKQEVDLTDDPVISSLVEAHQKLDDRIQEIEDTGDSIRELIDALKSDKGGTARRARLVAASSGNPVLSKLSPKYNAGSYNGGNIVSVAGPAGFGKSHAVRELGKQYDLYLEHGCNKDIDEISTILGSITPDGANGYIITDGVLTQAFRAAADGTNVLLFCDEHLRWTARTREFLLTTFQPVVNGEGDEVFKVRTRKPLDGNLEVLEAKVEHLHIIAACNLESEVPEAPYWDRFDHVKIDYNKDDLTVVCQSILNGFGVAEDPKVKLAENFAEIVGESRKAAVDGRTLFSLSPRDLKRAALFGGEEEADIARQLASAVSDKVQNWDADTGDRLPDGGASEGWSTRLIALADRAKAPEPLKTDPTE